MFWKANIVLPSDLSSRDIEAWSRFNIPKPGLTTAFLSYPYVLAAEKVFRNVRIFRLEDDGEPVLFFPFQYRSFIHRCFGIEGDGEGRVVVLLRRVLEPDQDQRLSRLVEDLQRADDDHRHRDNAEVAGRQPPRQDWGVREARAESPSARRASRTRRSGDASPTASTQIGLLH